MRRIILTLIALTLFGGVASADRGRGHRRDSGHARGGVVVRDHRTYDRPVRYERPRVYRNHDRVRYVRRPVYVNHGYYHFHGGYRRAYTRPIIKYRYYDYRYRPQVIIENYDPVPGYTWIQGQWHWNGYEWVWQAGYYAPDPRYQDPYGYDTDGDGYADDFDGDGYHDGYRY